MSERQRDAAIRRMRVERQGVHLLNMLKEVRLGMMCVCKLNPLVGAPVPCQTCRIDSVIEKAERKS